jgi:RNA polymerase subunit RPABC4/transcription elongation factor Spt4
MKKKECPSCAMEIDAKSTVCPICGYEFPVQNKIYVAVAIILLIVIALYFII